MSQAETFPTHLTRRTGAQGWTFDLPTTHRPGDTLSFNDAIFINQARQTYALNSFGARFKQLMDENPAMTHAEMNEEVQKYVAGYVWTQRGSSEPVDPLEREALKIARLEVAEKLRAKGRNTKGIDPETLRSVVAEYREKYKARIDKEANRRLKALAEIAEGEDDLISNLVAA